MVETTQLTRPPLPDDVRAALVNVVHHTWCDERDDYYSMPAERRPGHIFESLLVLRSWLGGEAPWGTSGVELPHHGVEGSVS